MHGLVWSRAHACSTRSTCGTWLQRSIHGTWLRSTHGLVGNSKPPFAAWCLPCRRGIPLPFHDTNAVHDWVVARLVPVGQQRIRRVIVRHGYGLRMNTIVNNARVGVSVRVPVVPACQHIDLNYAVSRARTPRLPAPAPCVLSHVSEPNVRLHWPQSRPSCTPACLSQHIPLDKCWRPLVRHHLVQTHQ